MIAAGAAQMVVVSTEAPGAGAALPVAVVSDGRSVLAGPPIKIVAVTDGRAVLAQPAMAIVLATGPFASAPTAGPPIAVVVVSGSL